ncbi:hypothetical protein ACFXHA_24300 [Nocardia sp. NPDC059240]|uniref:hypothetical protein n=1 Tax=Nocardia sp. NPDC059240 TaxID=3346786 RepID=UPI0036D0D339
MKRTAAGLAMITGTALAALAPAAQAVPVPLEQAPAVTQTATPVDLSPGSSAIWNVLYAGSGIGRTLDQMLGDPVGSLLYDTGSMHTPGGGDSHT